MSDNDESRDYSLKEPFFVDGNELDGLPPQEIFTLGVEWCYVFNDINSMEPGEQRGRPIHTANKDRVRMLLIRNNMKFEIKPYDEHWASFVYRKPDAIEESDHA